MSILYVEIICHTQALDFGVADELWCWPGRSEQAQVSMSFHVSILYARGAHVTCVFNNNKVELSFGAVPPEFINFWPV